MDTVAPLVDTHAHLDFDDYDPDRDEVVSRAEQAGLTAIITVGIEPEDWERNLEIARAYTPVFPALGIHPNSASLADSNSLARLAQLCSPAGEPRVVAVGETGLDFYRDWAEPAVQERAFKEQLTLARQFDLPVIIHNRDAHDRVLEILRRDGKGTRGVMHSFSGDLEFAKACLDAGYYISLSGPVTFKKAADKHEVAKWVPLDRLLLETDCPFLTPEPYRGRRNEPSYVRYTAEAVARIRGISVEDVAAATTANAAQLFGIQAQARAATVSTGQQSIEFEQ